MVESQYKIFHLLVLIVLPCLLFDAYVICSRFIPLSCHFNYTLGKGMHIYTCICISHTPMHLKKSTVRGITVTNTGSGASMHGIVI